MEQELLHRLLASKHLEHFVSYTFPSYEWSWHHRVICDTLAWWLATPGARLLIVAPPRHGKSELVSRRLPAFILGQNPDAQIIACSYSADLASRMNRDVQRVMDSPAYARVFRDTRLFGKNIRTVASGTWMRNSDLFEVVERKGAYRSSGVGGGITGMGFDFGIIDDPIKSAAEANSETLRESIWEWYITTFLTRQHKGARILLTLTRWHHDDLAGRLLKLQEEDPGADQWRVLHLPALALARQVEERGLCEEEAQEQAFHDAMDDMASRGDFEGVHVERTAYDDWLEERGRSYPVRPRLDPRQENEPLWPGRFGKDWLDQTRATMGERAFGALYGGNPTPREGALFPPENWQIVSALPAGRGRWVRYWDKGYSSRGDWTVGILMFRSKDGRFYVVDMVRVRLSPAQRNNVILSTAHSDRATHGHVRTYIEQPPGAGTETTDTLIRLLAGFPVEAVVPRGDKEDRAEPLSDQCEAGNVFLLADLPGRKALIEECATFPGGENDDIVDAVGGAFLAVALPSDIDPAKAVDVPHEPRLPPSRRETAPSRDRLEEEEARSKPRFFRR